MEVFNAKNKAEVPWLPFSPSMRSNALTNTQTLSLSPFWVDGYVGCLGNTSVQIIIIVTVLHTPPIMEMDHKLQSLSGSLLLGLSAHCCHPLGSRETTRPHESVCLQHLISLPFACTDARGKSQMHTVFFSP